MELTNQQLIYVLFAALVIALALAGIAYCVGLKTGQGAGFEQGRTTATDYWKPFCRNLRKDLINVEAQLDCRSREIRALRLNIEQETSDHQAVERALREELNAARAYALTWDDQQTLIKAVRQLGLAAQQFARSGSTKTNHAALHRDALSALAAKVQAAIDGGAVHPDTELIEWLDREATFWADHETGEIRFLFAASPNGHEHLRDVLQMAKQQAEEIEQNHATLLQEAAA
ncbi:hypothetical protein SA496_01105 [Pseudomonas sp. JS3066]|uniref:hypothetical protein n=1 Tax=Pseudomonas sp. JS3066 TaxID=3090665 RepID=UPI002E7C0ECE|nr:hypothetical protein [Pseudomonas sp. JS3066]WVK93814.1 hypothetical protein SA496_01105 [Pseudomonas sp. JS3066]